MRGTHRNQLQRRGEQIDLKVMFRAPMDDIRGISEIEFFV
ncbi:hypothetical protein N579_08260 [Corynebacterium pseudodiphtheriticum 090104]|jgi:hypothetical protein|nr:hypothetical protein N579_08260 [Corynebacterium pseudodiphtheriticum 090104]